MERRCPGRNANVLVKTTLVPCPDCGRIVEIFGDEEKVICRCGRHVFRAALPSCAQWCPAAEQCFGTIGGPARQSKERRDGPGREEQERRMKALQARIAEALAQCPTPEAQRKREKTESSVEPGNDPA